MTQQRINVLSGIVMNLGHFMNRIGSALTEEGCHLMDKQVKVEFIESYIKAGNDYQWNDNHGDLIRCKDCKHYTHHFTFDLCSLTVLPRKPEFYCADGERRDK